MTARWTTVYREIVWGCLVYANKVAQASQSRAIQNDDNEDDGEEEELEWSPWTGIWRKTIEW